MEEMHSVQSTDGVPIAYWKSGQGPHLVLVHGTSADHTRWRPVLPMFEKQFTVCAMDRRGRGGSGDAPDYRLEREYDDVAAVCDSLDGPVHLLGHSYGAVCALGAALRTANLARLVLYEPALTGEGIPFPADISPRLERLLEQGDRERVLTTFFREIVEMSDAELEAMQSSPSWQGRLAAAHTIPREEGAALPCAADFRDVRTPTLLLMGGESPRFLKAGTEALDAVLPKSHVVIMPGQAHVANTTAPDLFAREVLRFLLAE